MKIVRCIQGSDEWHAARLGIPTASNFSKLVTRSGKPSSQAHRYLCELVLERLTGRPAHAESTDWMLRGKAMEAEAVALFELTNGCDTLPGGFITTDDGRIGCSPDRLVGDDEGLEVKVLAAWNHVSALLGEPEGFYQQIQGSLWVSERKRWTLLCYNPEMAPAIVTYERDEAYIAALAEIVTDFCNAADAAEAKLRPLIEREVA